jgi:hypothetical protein
VPRLSVVDRPPVYAVRKGFFQIGYRRSANSDFDELPFVHENLEVVPPSFGKDFSARGGLEAIAFRRFGPEALRIEFDLVTGFIDVPREECYIRYFLRASKPSGVFIIIYSLSSFSSLLLIKNYYL